MKRCYEQHAFRGGAAALVQHAEKIMDEYAADGYDLTLRQLYYQFVARDLIANNEKNYKRLGDIISKARLAGLLDWDIMVDRTRAVRAVTHWDGPSELVSACAKQFRLDSRSDQKGYIEAWVEKEALAGIVVPVCHELDIDSLVCRGFVSQSAMRQGAMRFKRHENMGQHCVLLYMGDHDPSGIDMTRDIEDRLNQTFGTTVLVNRIALTMDQVDQFNPPPNPAKQTDSRYTKYVEQYGPECWEMDALDPRTLSSIITDAVDVLTDEKRRKRLLRQQDKGREQLQSIAQRLADDPKWKP